MSNQQFREFYREKGVQTIDSLYEPEPYLIKKLPVASTIHYLGNPDEPGLDTSDPLMKGYNNKVVFHNVRQYDPAYNIGAPRTPDMQSHIAKFLKENRNFMYMKTLKELATVTANQLEVIDYSWLESFNKVTPTKIILFDQTESLLRTLTYTIKQINVIGKRNHFVVMPVPASLVAKSQLDTKALTAQPQLSNTFYGLDEQFLRHVWLFLNPKTRSASMFAGLSEDDYKSINLIFKMYDGKYAILNLGYLFSFIRGSNNLTLANRVNTKTFIDVQKYYLRSMISLQTFEANGANLKAQEEALAKQQEQVAAVDKSEEEGSELDQRFLQDAEVNAAALRDEAAFGSVISEIKPSKGPTKEGDIPDVQSEINDKLTQKNLDADLEALEEIHARKAIKKLTPGLKAEVKKQDKVQIEEETGYTSDIVDDVDSIRRELFTNRSPEDALTFKLNTLVDEGRVSPAEFRRKRDLIKAAKTLPNPYGGNLTIEQASIVTKKDLMINPEEAKMNVPSVVIDKSMATSTLNVIGPKYDTDLIYKDMLACVQYAQKGGVIIKDHTVERMSTNHGEYDVHTLEITPLLGQSSIIRARLPVVNEEGFFTAKSSHYRMRSQRVDLPIRKIGANRVGLASYYGKTFIDRATKKANSSLAYVLARLAKATISPDEHLREVSPGNVFDNYFEAPYIYAGLSESYQSFNAGNLHIDVNPKGFRASIDPKIREQLEVSGARIAGHTLTGKKALVLVDVDNNFYTFNSDGLKLIGDIYTVLQLDKRLAPIDYAEVKIFSKSVPVGVYMARIVGFRKLVKMLGATHRIVEGKQQKNLLPHEYVVQFKDFAYVFDSRQQVNSLILAGFHAFEKETKLFNAEMFDSQPVYLRLFEARGLNIAYTREMDNIQDMFVDPITERILKEMQEPTTFNGLLIRACELLKTYYYPASQDLDYQRIRGYDRFPGFFYKELINSIRDYKQKNSTGRGKVNMSPFQLWTTITRDASVKHIEDINPIQSLKITQEAVTYVGEGGRSKESMNKESRAFLPSDMGVDAGDSIDSGDVGVNTFKSADPIFMSVDGLKDKKIPVEDLEPANLLATSVLMAPFAVNDDPKRRAFIGIQQAHTVSSEGYGPPMVRTGYESVIGMRTGSMFAKAATAPGVVTNITDKGITVKLEDGTEKGYALGTLYGKAEGSVYPHPLVTDMKVGQKFKKGDYITYNKNFFEKDPLFDGGMVYKGSLMVRVALVELPETHEDSSTISESLSRRFRSTVTKVKTYTVNFKQNVTNVIKIGQKVSPEDILMTIEDEITAMDDSLSSNSLDILSERSKNSPKSGYVGQISDIEVIYHGDTSDMSNSLKSLVNQSNRNKAREAASRLKTATTGETDSEYTVDGVPLGLGKAVIRVYINVSDNASLGDKIVFGNQLKSVIGEVMTYTMRSENGDIIDAKMGAKSFAARIVRSTVMIGERANALHAIAKTAVKIYRG